MLTVSRRLIASFVFLLLLPGAAVTWLGVKLIEQDRDVARAQNRDRMENAAGRVIVALQQAVTAAERSYTPSNQPGKGAMLVMRRGGGLDVYPAERLIFANNARSLNTSDTFAAADALEFRDRNYAGAAEALRPLAESASAEARAGALVRIARNLRQLGKTADALRTYQELERVSGGDVDGVPADLVARRAEVAMLRRMGRGPEADRKEDVLAQDLVAGRWRLDRGTFDEYIGEHPVDPGAVAMAEAAAWFQEQTRPAGQEALDFGGIPVTVLWRDGTAFISGPEFQKQAWFKPLFGPSGGLDVELVAGGRAVYGGWIPRSGFVMHNAADTGLPWDIYLTPAGPGGGGQPYPWEVQRRNLLWAGLILLVGMVVGGGYFMLRAVAKELAVARQQNEFVAAVSHEFRTPLTSLRQFTDLLQDDDALPAEKRRTFYQAQARATARLQGLVESLLDFGRMEAGAQPYRRNEMDVAEWVREVAADFGREAADRGFTVETSVAEDLGTAAADRDAITRALWNLLDNAVKYSGDSRTVWVRAERRDGEVAIAVEDHGIGIPRSEQAGVFRRFVRGVEAQRNGIKGTGIGLAMVQHIVQAHDGRVELESAPGQGSVFTIRLPLAGEAR